MARRLVFPHHCVRRAAAAVGAAAAAAPAVCVGDPALAERGRTEQVLVLGGERQVVLSPFVVAQLLESGHRVLLRVSVGAGAALQVQSRPRRVSFVEGTRCHDNIHRALREGEDRGMVVLIPRVPGFD